MFEQRGFIVCFFDRPLGDWFAAGFAVVELIEFDEWALPRKLLRIMLRKP